MAPDTTVSPWGSAYSVEEWRGLPLHGPPGTPVPTSGLIPHIGQSAYYDGAGDLKISAVPISSDGTYPGDPPENLKSPWWHSHSDGARFVDPANGAVMVWSATGGFQDSGQRAPAAHYRGDGTVASSGFTPKITQPGETPPWVDAEPAKVMTAQDVAAKNFHDALAGTDRPSHPGVIAGPSTDLEKLVALLQALKAAGITL